MRFRRPILRPLLPELIFEHFCPLCWYLLKYCPLRWYMRRGKSSHRMSTARTEGALRCFYIVRNIFQWTTAFRYNECVFTCNPYLKYSKCFERLCGLRGGWKVFLQLCWVEESCCSRRQFGRYAPVRRFSSNTCQAPTISLRVRAQIVPGSTVPPPRPILKTGSGCCDVLSLLPSIAERKLQGVWGKCSARDVTQAWSTVLSRQREVSCVSKGHPEPSSGMASNSRRNSTSVATPSLSRRGSCDSETSSVFPNNLKRGKPVSQVKITFMGKPMVRQMVSVSETTHPILSGTSGSHEWRREHLWRNRHKRQHWEEVKEHLDRDVWHDRLDFQQPAAAEQGAEADGEWTELKDKQGERGVQSLLKYEQQRKNRVDGGSPPWINVSHILRKKLLSCRARERGKGISRTVTLASIQTRLTFKPSSLMDILRAHLLKMRHNENFSVCRRK